MGRGGVPHRECGDVGVGVAEGVGVGEELDGREDGHVHPL